MTNDNESREMDKPNDKTDQENEFARALEQLHEQIIATDHESADSLSSERSNDQRFQSAAEILRLLELKVERDGKHGLETLAAASTKWSAFKASNSSELDVPTAKLATKSESLVPDLHNLGRFTIVEQIGRGGFGIVVRARDEDLDRDVAIKIPRLESALSSEARVRFEREARAAASLNHPSIVSVYETGWQDGTGYIVSELVDGVNLADWLAKGNKPTAKECAQIMLQLADAIEHSHQRGVLHRDLKPSNVLLKTDAGSKTVLITDFGLASIVDQQDFTQTGAAVGTPAYMSPEQAAGNKKLIGPATDVYGLGTILYQMLSGQAPFAELSTFELLRAVIDRDPSLPSSFGGEVPRDVEAICMKCLAKDPQHRYASAIELRADLQRFIDGSPVIARPVTRLDRIARWVKRNQLVSSLAILLIVGLTVGLVTMTVLWQTSETNRKLAEKNETLYQQKSKELGIAFDNLLISQKEAVQNLNLYLAKSDQLTNAINQLFVDLANSPEVQKASADGLRRTLLNEANTFYVSFVSEAPDDVQAKLEHARLLKSLSQINLLLGDSKNGAQLAAEAIDVYFEIEGDIEFQPGELAGAVILKGRCLTKSGDFINGNHAFDDALDLLGQQLGDSPDFSTVPGDPLRLYASTMAQKSYSLLHQDKLKEANEIVTTAMLAWDAIDLEDEEHHQATLFTRMDIGFCKFVKAETLRLKRQYKEAEQLFQSAISDFSAAGELYCQRENGEFEKAKALRGLGLIDALSGKFADAIIHYREAIALFEKLVADRPLVESYAKLLSSTRYSLTGSLLELNQLDKAQLEIETNIVEKQQLIERYPDSAAATYSYLGDAFNVQYVIAVRKKQSSLDELEQLLSKAINAFETSSEMNPSWARPKMALARCRINYGSLLIEMNQLEEAKLQYKTSREELNALITQQESWTEPIDAYYGATTNLIAFHIDQNEFEEAIELVSAVTARWPDHPRSARFAFGKPKLIAQAGRISEARDEMKAALETWGKTENDYLYCAERAVKIAAMENVQQQGESVTMFEDLSIEILQKGYDLADDKNMFTEKIAQSSALAELIERRQVTFE